MPHTKELRTLSYAVPYVIPGRSWTQRRLQADLREITNVDLAMQKRLLQGITTWCRNHKFLIEAGTTFIPNVTIERELPPSLIYQLNYRQLCFSKPLDDLTFYLDDRQVQTTGAQTGDLLTNKLINLTVYLATMVPLRTLDQYINNLYTALHAVTDPDAADEKLGSYFGWEYVHENYPFLWVIYAIQGIMHAHAPQI